jgi:hypothetical protein
MPDTRLTRRQIKERGDAIYEERLRASVETEPNIGKIISIDLETSDFEIDDDLIAAVRRLQARHPAAVTWTKRIGYDAVYSVGGTLMRTAR